MAETINDKVFDLYKTLDFALKRAAGFPDGKSGVAPYIHILPASRAGQLDKIRKWRNDGLGHGVGSAPLARADWVTFLQSEIRYVETHRATLRPKLIAASERMAARKGGYDHPKTPTTPTRERSATGAPTHRPQYQTPQKPRVDSGNGQINARHEYNDKENAFHAELEVRNGKGRFIEKHLFKPDKNLLDFGVVFSFSGKIKHYKAEVWTKNGWVEIYLKAGEVTPVKMATAKIDGNLVKVRVSFEYKIGLFMAKKGAITVGKHF